MIRFAHTNIISHDWRKLADFYVKTFGCVIVPPIRNQSGDWLSAGTGVENARLQGAHLGLPGYDDNGPTLEIYQYEEIVALDEVAPNQRGFGHIAFEVDNVAAILGLVEKNGGTSQGNITTRKVEGVGQITFVYARDPEGNLLELQNWQRE